MTFTNFFIAFREKHSGWHPTGQEVWDGAAEEIAQRVEAGATAKDIRAMQSRGFRVIERFLRRKAA